MNSRTRMYHEIQQIPEAAHNLLTEGRPAVVEAARLLKETNPLYYLTVARGSSDHVACYFSYLCSLMLQVPVASVGPSIASVYGSRLNLQRSVTIGISQSGQSPDIATMVESASANRSVTLAITNNPDSRLAQVSRHVLPMCAGEEKSVAATKTFVNSALLSLMLLAEITKDSAVASALMKLPDYLARAVLVNWDEFIDYVQEHRSLYVLGRGPSYAMATEAALKFKETCQIHAESYSSAEVLHGPVSMALDGFPLLVFAARDRAEQSVVAMADKLSRQGALVYVTSDKVKDAHRLDFVKTENPYTDPLTLICSFYTMVERLAGLLGKNVDAPQLLQKVTQTV